ncbi:MAG: transposase [Thermoguttaceae bacterium]|nr:transposase [Thermoguttaceae bacterium]
MPKPQRPQERHAYHIVFTTYGAWLHGDKRGSWSSMGFYVSPNTSLEQFSRLASKHPAVLLTPPMRRVVFDGICAEADFHQWKIYALNVLDNHVHLLISTPCEINGEIILARVKAGATAALRNAGYFLDRRPIWTSSGLPRLVETDGYFQRVREYINHKQKWEPFVIFD